jgi:hypothetical protein
MQAQMQAQMQLKMQAQMQAQMQLQMQLEHEPCNANPTAREQRLAGGFSEEASAPFPDGVH